MLSERDLLRWYRTYNDRYFRGALPEEVDILWAPVVDGYAEVDFHRDKHSHSRLHRQEAGEFVILISPSIAAWTAQWRWALLHEMAHVGLWPYQRHGPRFQAEMLRLAQAGAFRNIW
jgi:uncharacterized membrane protein YcjF (UPF0283 family)